MKSNNPRQDGHSLRHTPSEQGASWSQAEVVLSTVLATIVISALCIMFFSTVQDFMMGNTVWNGLSRFSQEIEANCVDSFAELPESPSGKVMLSIPYISYTDDELIELKRFVTQGGKLILMDDYGNGNQLLEYLDIETRFSNKTLIDLLFCYRNPRLPRITDFSPEIHDNGINAIVLNHATVLTKADPDQVIAWSSDQSFLEYHGYGEWQPVEPDGPLPIAAEVKLGNGVILLISDPSIFINSMIGLDDNEAFLRYLIGFNTEPDDIFIDRLHLEKSPLDQTKLALADVRDIFSHPPVAVGMLAVTFAGASWYLIRKGEKRA